MPQTATLMSLAHPGRERYRSALLEMATTIGLYQPVWLLGAGDLPDSDLPPRVSRLECPTDDIWTRDFGPLPVQPGCLRDFAFNGWGLKYTAAQDNLASRWLRDSGWLGEATLKRSGLVLEGGSVDSDGQGTILTTLRCLLEPNRNPHLSRLQLEATLVSELAASRMLWLEHGELPGDDTDGHVDLLARFVSPGAIAYACGDSKPLRAMRQELENLTTPDGRSYELVPLPVPDFAWEQSLPASYVNFSIVNGAVLVPAYGEVADELARERIAGCFPQRRAISQDCRTLVAGGGGCHCASLQLVLEKPPN